MVPQLVIYLDTAGNLHAELPALNGSRRKVEFGSLSDLKVALLDERQRLLDNERKAAQERHRRVWDLTASNFGGTHTAVAFTNRVIGPRKSEGLFNQPKVEPKPKSSAEQSLSLTSSDLDELEDL